MNSRAYDSDRSSVTCSAPSSQAGMATVDVRRAEDALGACSRIKRDAPRRQQRVERTLVQIANQHALQQPAQQRGNHERHG